MGKTHAILRVGLGVAEDFERAVWAFLRQAEARNLSPVTLDWYSRMLKPLKEFALSRGLAPGEVSRDTLQELLLSLNSQAAPTRNAHLRAIRAFFGWLHREGYLAANPTTGLSCVKEFRMVLPVLSLNQLQAFLRAMKSTT